MPENVKQGTVYIMLAFAVSSVVGYASQVTIARILGPEDYGLFGILASCVAIVVALSSGIPNAMVVFVSKNEAANDKKMVYATVKSGIRLQAFFVLAFVTVVLFLNSFLRSKLFNGAMPLFLAFLLVAPSRCYYGISAGVLQGLREQKLMASMEVGQSVLNFLLISILLVVLGLGFAGVVGAYIINSLLLCAAGFVLMKLVIQERSEKLEAIDIMSVIKFALPASLANIVGSLLMKSPPILVKTLGTDNVDALVGYTVIILSLAGIADRAIKVVFRAGYPHISRWCAQNDIRSLNLYARRMGLATLFGCTLFLFSAYFLAPAFIRTIYGRAYMPIVKYIIPTIIVFGVVSIANMYKAVIYAIGQPTRYLYLTIGSLAIYASSVYLLKGIVDAVMSVILAIGFSNLFLVIGSVAMKKGTLVRGKVH